MSRASSIFSQCVDFINTFPRVNTKHHQYSLHQYLLEFRTIDLRLPRQTGKSTAAWRLYTTLPAACLIVPNYDMKVLSNSPSLLCGAEVRSYPNMTLKCNSIVPYQYVILDEQPITHDLFNSPGFGDMLMSDTIIIALSTPKVNH